MVKLYARHGIIIQNPCLVQLNVRTNKLLNKSLYVVVYYIPNDIARKANLNNFHLKSPPSTIAILHLHFLWIFEKVLASFVATAYFCAGFSYR